MDKNREIKLLTLESDIQKIGETLQEASETIINENISNYPLFVAHQHAVAIGIELFDKDQQGINWSFNATTLEEMVAKKIVEVAKLEDFKAIYKSPEEFVCIFILDDDSSEFIFYPYALPILGNSVSDE